MQLDTAVHTVINQKEYPHDRVVEAAMTISAEMVTHPRMLSLFGNRELPDLEHMSLTDLVDELGLIKAQIKNLEIIKEYAEHQIKISGQTRIDGVCFSATIGKDYTRTTLSLEKLEKNDPQLYKQCVKHFKFSTVKGAVTVKAR